MEDAVLVCVVHNARYLSDEFHRVTDRHRLAASYLIKLAAFNELHAEVAGAIALAHFVDGNNPRVIEACGSFRFASKTLQVRFCGPMAQTNHLQRHCAVQTFLPGAIHHTLTATTDLFQQFVIPKVGEFVSGDMWRFPWWNAFSERVDRLWRSRSTRSDRQRTHMRFRPLTFH